MAAEYHFHLLLLYVDSLSVRCLAVNVRCKRLVDVGLVGIRSFIDVVP